jgi:hypothetical protein
MDILTYRNNILTSTAATEEVPSPGTKGSTIGYGAGVEGQSVYGVGGRFAGNTAQVHLVTAASSHPETGEAGQLFVDKANRLWYCRGARDWRRLA